MLPVITPRLSLAIAKSFRFGFVRDYSRIPVTARNYEWFSIHPQPFMPVCSKPRKERLVRFLRVSLNAVSTPVIFLIRQWQAPHGPVRGFDGKNATWEWARGEAPNGAHTDDSSPYDFGFTVPD